MLIFLCPLALGPSGAKRVGAMKLDSSENLRRPQAIQEYPASRAAGAEPAGHCGGDLRNALRSKCALSSPGGMRSQCERR